MSTHREFFIGVHVPFGLSLRKEGHSNPWVTVSPARRDQAIGSLTVSMVSSRSAKRGNTQWQDVPESVSEFLRGKRIAVAGVSRASGQPANAIYRRLKDCGYEVFAINPNASKVEGVTAYPDLASIPVTVDGVVIATHPDASARYRAPVQQAWSDTSLVPPVLRGWQRVTKVHSRVRGTWSPLHRRRLPAHVLRSSRLRAQMYEVVASAAGPCSKVNVQQVT